MTDNTTIYKAFFGVDMAKYDFVAVHDGATAAESYTNNKKGFASFFAKHGDRLKQALVVIENTGGCEQALIRFLFGKGVAVHRADASRVRAFIRSHGTRAKTDSMDAHGLCRYAAERHASLVCVSVEDKDISMLRTLLGRRNDLVKMQAAEKNRLQAPEVGSVRSSISKHLVFLAGEIAAYDRKIKELFNAKPELSRQAALLQEIPGVGSITAQNLLAFMPELGHTDRRKVAGLAGVAPIAKDSGCSKGYRGTWGGRTDLRAKLFTAAMAAARSKSALGEYYKNMLQRGKHKMVAIVALMRKIIVIANAKLRDFNILSKNLLLQPNHS